MALKLFTFGAATIVFNHQSVDGQFGAKARALLFYTALQSQPVSRELLATMFWKDAPQERASGNLRMALMALRDRLGESAHITRTDVSIEAWSDMQTFQANLNTLAPLLSCPPPWDETHLQQIEDTLQLYKGPFLQNISLPDAEQFELWAHTTREVMRRQFLKAGEDLISYYERIGGYAEGLHWGTHLLKIDPLYEPAYRSLMRLYVRRGERVLAIREFETCKQLLASELNVAPDSETLALYDQIMAGTFPDSEPSISTSSVSVTPRRPIPHNLPGRLTPLVGRTAELNDIKHLLQEARLVTLVGAGGIGKTRLSAELAAQMLADQMYPDGIYFVDLSSIQYPSQVIESVADVLDIAESHQMSLSAQILRFLKQKRLLLILDNFEHVLDAAEQVEDWLKASAQLTILVTSREPLQLYAEYLYTLPSLPDADAVTLFAKRVSAVKSGFLLAPDNQADVEAICTRLEGLPLAVELAASHAQNLSLPQILQGLNDSLTFLKSQRRGGPQRQRTMYETIEWSYQLLTPSEQALYRVVSVFMGGWTLDSVEAVGGELASSLPALVSKQLVQMTAESPARYRMLEPIREHARSKLAEQHEAFLFEAAHLHYFTHLAETGGRFLRSNEQRLWFDRLEPERDNFRAALSFADEHSEFSEQLCQLMSGLGYFYYVRGYIREGREWIEKALGKQEELPLNIQADLLANAGHIAHASGEYALADEYHQAALSHYQTLEDWVNCSFMISIIAGRLVEEEKTLSLAKDAYDLAQRTNDDFVWLNAANTYAVLLEQFGHLDQARQVFEDLISAGKHLSNETLRPFISFNLGCIYRDIGRLQPAVQLFDEAMTLVRQSFVKIAFPAVFEEIGDFYYSLGHIDQAAACIDEGLAAAEAMGVETYTRRLQRSRAMIAWAYQNPDEMKMYYQLAFQGLIDTLPTEQWNSFISGVFHIAEILALKQQPELSTLLLRTLAHCGAARKTRPTYIHLQLKERCLNALRRYQSESKIQDALQRGEILSETEMFAQALAAVDAHF